MLNFTENAVDSDFTTAQVKAAINRGYDREIRAAKLRSNQDYFRSTLEFTWPSGDLDFSLTSQMRKTEWLRLEDVTDSVRGLTLEIAKSSVEGNIYMPDRNTLRWGTEGPQSERTIRLTYLAAAETLIEDEDEPQLISPEYHELLAYSAAVELRAFADEEIPSAWQKRYLQFQMEFQKVVTRGRPHIGGDVTVINRHPDDYQGAFSGNGS